MRGYGPESAKESKTLILAPGAFYVMDRAYIDFLRLNGLNECAAFFVARGKNNLWFKRLVRQWLTKQLEYDAIKPSALHILA
jgi:hypothetical protein